MTVTGFLNRRISSLTVMRACSRSNSFIRLLNSSIPELGSSTGPVASRVGTTASPSRLRRMDSGSLKPVWSLRPSQRGHGFRNRFRDHRLHPTQGRTCLLGLKQHEPCGFHIRTASFSSHVQTHPSHAVYGAGRLLILGSDAILSRYCWLDHVVNPSPRPQ